jgi:hypothetical protein
MDKVQKPGDYGIQNWISSDQSYYSTPSDICWGLHTFTLDHNKVYMDSVPFILYINHLPNIVNDNADNTSIIMTVNPTDITNSVNKILQDINRWFTTNLLSLNAEKAQYMQFVTKTSSLIDLHVMCKNKEMADSCNTTFLRLTSDNTFLWKNHIDTVGPKLSSACFTVRAVKPFLSQESLRIVYLSCCHSIMTYGLVFWGNSYHSNTVLNCKRELVELWWGLDIESHAENISGN